jgi:hypothetical protein
MAYGCSIIGILHIFLIDAGGSECVDDEVGPEEVHDDQAEQHEDHEQIACFQHISFEHCEFVDVLEIAGDRWDDGHCREEEESPCAPGDKGVDVGDVENALRVVFVVLHGGRGTL